MKDVWYNSDSSISKIKFEYRTLFAWNHKTQSRLNTVTL